jgi:hypothetical protein
MIFLFDFLKNLAGRRHCLKSTGSQKPVKKFAEKSQDQPLRQLIYKKATLFNTLWASHV